MPEVWLELAVEGPFFFLFKYVFELLDSPSEILFTLGEGRFVEHICDED